GHVAEGIESSVSPAYLLALDVVFGGNLINLADRGGQLAKAEDLVQSRDGVCLKAFIAHFHVAVRPELLPSAARGEQVACPVAGGAADLASPEPGPLVCAHHAHGHF